ncbi:MAG: helix-turn-helix transcriptional regulator, partial [Bacteroidota bacterium]|nr:helix-turn-helix transcriptional regulator [Bacteroidota bacterium]
SQNTDIASLSSRQIEILKLWGESYTNQEIADRFFISVRTVESHKNHIMQKLNLKSTVDMVKFAIKNNIIEI